MKRDLHNLNLGFIQLKRNVLFDSTDHDCPKEPPRSEWAPNRTRAPIAQDSSKGNQCARRSKHSTNRIWLTRTSQGNYRRTPLFHQLFQLASETINIYITPTRGGSRGEVIFFTRILYNSENNIRDKRPFCRRLFCHRSVVKHTPPLSQQRSRYESWLPNITETTPPPKITGWIRPWPRQWSYMRIWNRLNMFYFIRYAYLLIWCAHPNTVI